MPEIIEPVPGDATTEPVATAEQSHVNGRVGPPTFAQDPGSELNPDGVPQYAPGLVLPADTPRESGPGIVADELDGAGAGEPVVPTPAKPAAKPAKG